MAGWLAEKTRTVSDSAALWVIRPKIKPIEPGMGNCACTHRARFQRHPDVTAVKPVAAKQRSCRPDRQNFCVCCRIVETPGRIGGDSNDSRAEGYHCPHRHFLARRSSDGGLKRCAHGIR